MNQNPEPRTLNREPGTLNAEPDRFLTYVCVVVLEAAIIAALWFFGRIFS